MAVSHTTSLGYKYRFKGGETSTETFEAHAFSIYSGGALDKGFSYFTELYFHENSGANTGAGDFGDYGRSKLAESYIQYTRGSDSGFMTFRFGQIQPQILHIHNMGARTSQGRPNLWSAKFNGDNAYTAFSRQYGVDAAGTTVSGSGYYLEGFYWMDDHKGFYGRFENVDPDVDVSDNEMNGITVGATWRPMEYGRVVLDIAKYGPTDARKMKFTLEFNFMW